MKSNCFFYALGRWIREGGYLEIRRSHSFRWVPHFLHLSRDRRELRHFQPVERKFGWRGLWHMLWFEGDVQRED